MWTWSIWSSSPGKSEEELVSQLQGVIFRLPDAAPKEERPQYVTADEYLSGNVREKLEQAQNSIGDQ